MGRRKLYSESALARFSAGTLARIKRALRPKEARTDFIRLAVEKELDRREAESAQEERKDKPE